ncbi:OFA family MFS transporter [Caldiplasma sukawensis]
MKRFYLTVGLTVMLFNSLYQYSWNVLEPRLVNGFNTGTAEIEVAFTIFGIFSTVFQGPGGYIADRFGPRYMGVIAAIMAASGFLFTPFLSNVFLFYVLWAFGSTGEGILYGIASNLAVKWFRERRGFAVGIVSLGFGAGASLGNIFIEQYSQFRTPMFIIGIVEFAILPLLLWFTKYPDEYDEKRTAVQAIIDGRFWIIYAAFFMGTVPLIVVSSNLPVFGSTLSKFNLAVLVSLFPFLSGVGRPFMGILSDRIGRINVSLIIGLMLILGSVFLIYHLFIFSIILIGLFGGSMISTYIALVGDLFGPNFSTANNGILYTGKAIGSVLGSVVFFEIFSVLPLYSYIYVTLAAVVSLIFLNAGRSIGKKQASSIESGDG